MLEKDRVFPIKRMSMFAYIIYFLIYFNISVSAIDVSQSAQSSFFDALLEEVGCTKVACTASRLLKISCQEAALNLDRFIKKKTDFQSQMLS